MKIQLTVVVDTEDVPATVAHHVMDFLNFPGCAVVSCSALRVDAVVQEDGKPLMQRRPTDEPVEYQGVCGRCGRRAAVDAKTGYCKDHRRFA